jgi:hypothetical protein
MHIVKRNFGLEVDAGRKLSAGRNFLPQIGVVVHGCGAELGGNFGGLDSIRPWNCRLAINSQL